MRVRNIKVKTPAIPSRTAACQFIDVHGYDMEWVPEQKLFYVHDVQKKQLHVIAAPEVTNFTLDTEPKPFMAELRRKLGEAGDQLHAAVAVRAREEAVAAKEQAVEVAETKRKERRKKLEQEEAAEA